MRKTLSIAFVLTLITACGVAAGGGGGTPVTPGVSSTTTTTTTGGDGNALFVIAPIDNNVIIQTPAVPQVANFTVADTVTFQYPFHDGVAGVSTTIILNSTPNACNDANANALHVGETQLAITITDLPDMVLAANTYVFPAGANDPYEIATATFAVVQSPCAYNSVGLTSGQVIVTDVQPYASITGSYNLVFPTGTISGTFTTAPTCTAVSVTPATAPTCN